MFGKLAPTCVVDDRAEHDDARPMAAAGLELQRMSLLAVPAGVDMVAPAVSDTNEIRAAVTGEDIAAFASVGVVAYTHGGTAPGPEGVDELREATAMRLPSLVDFERRLFASSDVVRMAAMVDDVPVSTGVVQHIGGVAELTGIGTLPAFRRVGHGARVTRALVEAGGGVRVSNAVPMKLLVRDGVEAMISLRDPVTGAQGLTSAVIRHPDLVGPLQLLFDKEWKRGRRLTPTPQDGRRGRR